MKIDGRLSYRGEVTPLQKVMLARRSYRKYRAGGVTPEQAREIEETAALFCGRMGYRAPVIRATVDPGEFKTVVGAAMAGGIGKTNPWLALTKANGVVTALCDVENAPASGDRVTGLAQTAMAMEAAVLRATEMGLATCWMSGVNTRAIEKALGLPDGRQCIAISTIGQPPQGVSLLSWDGVAYHMLSKRRKPLDQILFEEVLSPL